MVLALWTDSKKRRLKSTFFFLWIIIKLSVLRKVWLLQGEKKSISAMAVRVEDSTVCSCVWVMHGVKSCSSHAVCPWFHCCHCGQWMGAVWGQWRDDVKAWTWRASLRSTLAAKAHALHCRKWELRTWNKWDDFFLFSVCHFMKMFQGKRKKKTCSFSGTVTFLSLQNRQFFVFSFLVCFFFFFFVIFYSSEGTNFNSKGKNRNNVN